MCVCVVCSIERFVFLCRYATTCGRKSEAFRKIEAPLFCAKDEDKKKRTLIR